MKCRFIHDTPKARPDVGYFPAGTEIDVRTSPRFNREQIIILVQIGCAEPADEECRKAVNRTDAQLVAAQRSYNRVRKGIHPDDFAAFDSGVMDGYDSSGKPIPGPSYVEPDEDEDEEYEEEDEDDE